MVSPTASLSEASVVNPLCLFPSSTSHSHCHNPISLNLQLHGKLKLPCTSPLTPLTTCSAHPPSSLPLSDSDGKEAQDTAPVATSPDGATRGDRRKVVRLAWEKLVRWSRSWRSKSKASTLDVLQRTNKVVVLGGGSFGTAMAAHIADRKAELDVHMLVRDAQVCDSINQTHCNYKYFPQHKLPENITATSDAKAALLGADYCFHAVPVQLIFPRGHCRTC